MAKKIEQETPAKKTILLWDFSNSVDEKDATSDKIQLVLADLILI